MFDQIFALTDLPRVLFLAFLEIILSADNAIVIGLLASRLPKNLQAKALYIGVISSFVIRALALASVGLIIQYRFIRLIGAAYLLFISLNALLSKKKKKISPKTQSFWKIVILIELFDLIFAVDSILAGLAVISSNDPLHFLSKIWIVYIGGMMGLIGIRYAAHIFTKILSKFPRMETCGYLMISWIALKLVFELFFHSPLVDSLFWVGLMGLFFFGFVREKKTNG